MTNYPSDTWFVHYFLDNGDPIAALDAWGRIDPATVPSVDRTTLHESIEASIAVRTLTASQQQRVDGIRKRLSVGYIAPITTSAKAKKNKGGIHD